MSTKSPKFKWTASITIEVAETWVADGFELTDERLREMLQQMMERELRFAYEGEFKIGGQITSAPPRDEIRAVQGYAPSPRPSHVVTPLSGPAFADTRCPVCGGPSHSHDCR